MTLTGGDSDLTGTTTYAGSQWTCVFSGLPRWRYDADGNATEIDYQVVEEDLAGY